LLLIISVLLYWWNWWRSNGIDSRSFKTLQFPHATW